MPDLPPLIDLTKLCVLMEKLDYNLLLQMLTSTGTFFSYGNCWNYTEITKILFTIKEQL